MTPYLLVFLAGIAGSMHCVGMCGGFACALGRGAGGPLASLLRHLTYNLGRLASYAFLGAVAGYAGILLVGWAGEGGAGPAAQRALAVVSGLLMVYIGLQFLGLLRAVPASLPWAGIEVLAQALRRMVGAQGLTAPLALGVLNGFLPCPLVYAFAAQAAAAGGPAQGLAIMAAFGLGTFPAMLAMGAAGLWLRRGGAGPPAQPVHAPFLAVAVPLPRPDWRRLGVRAAGGFIVVLGLVTLVRGLWSMGPHALMGHGA